MGFSLKFVVVLPLLLAFGVKGDVIGRRVQLRQKPSGERTFVDEAGRELMFHGVNAIVKGPPWVPETNYWDGDISLGEKDMADLESLGLNVIRLGSMWPGLEPEQGKFSEAYLNKLKEITANAADHGIYTILDMHQDVLSENFCGEGAPNWVVQLADLPDGATFPAPKNENTSYTEDPDNVAADGFPLRSDCSKSGWASYYSTYDCSYTFEQLYTNPQLVKAWSGFWSYLAKAFKGDETVLGYELINEPWAGDVFNKPSLYIPGVADRERLQPVYDQLVRAIRAIDEETLVFFAAVTWDDVVPAGFTAAPGGGSEADRSVFAYHYYEPPQARDEHYFSTRLQDAQRLQVGSMLTEFERPRNSDPDAAGAERDPFFDTATAADRNLQSWAMWELKTFCKESNDSIASDSQNAAFGSCKTGYGESNYLWDSAGNVNPIVAKKLARTYPLAVAGNTTSMVFHATTRLLTTGTTSTSTSTSSSSVAAAAAADATVPYPLREGDFVLEYTLDTFNALPTEIFAHASLYYDRGYQVSVEPEGILTWQEPCSVGSSSTGKFSSSSSSISSSGGRADNVLKFYPARPNSMEDFGTPVKIFIRNGKQRE
mmetsp:Transcript_32558/g.54897  ORF Transcript_32558/g.54897 Transcript_32558/m.54897 type:complete len:600 (+) Transcript_32558:3-1802(+)